MWGRQKARRRWKHFLRLRFRNQVFPPPLPRLHTCLIVGYYLDLENLLQKVLPGMKGMSWITRRGLWPGLLTTFPLGMCAAPEIASRKVLKISNKRLQPCTLY